MLERNSRIATLAASFVITVGATACGTGSTGGRHQNPPIPTVDQEDPPPPDRQGTIVTRDDGTCWLEFASDCGDNTPCRPPQPQQVDCPGALPQPDTAKTVTRRDDGTCWQEGEMPDFECPPPESGTTCNPPGIPQIEVVCPGSHLPKAGPGAVDVRLDGTCWQSGAIPKFTCPKSDGGIPVPCNPPPPELIQVQCEPPKPKLPDANYPATVEKLADGTCWEIEMRHDPPCPPGVLCNPPPPKRTQVNCD